MPHLKALVERYEDAPFAVVGVNSGDSPEKFEAGVEKYGLTWVSAYQGDSKAIQNLFRVRGFPTYYLLDAEGVIRGTGHNGKAFDAQIEKLVEAAR